MKLLIIVAFSLFYSTKAKITCDVQSYILSGLEFSRCHQSTMETFSTSPINFNPCPALKHLVYTCSEVLKQCYDERGWLKGRQTLLELLALQYPDKDECDLFSKEAQAEVPQQLDDEKCSINDEVALTHDMRSCSSDAQGVVLSGLMQHPINKSNGTISSEGANHYFDIVCGSLKEVSDKCFVKKLATCFDDEEASYHLAVLLEDLRLTGITLMSHLTSRSNNTGDFHLTDAIDIDNCPVFANGPLAIYLSHQTTLYKTKASSVLITIFLVVFTTLTLVGLLSFVIHKFRLLPRIRARFLDTSAYTDFEAQEGPESRPIPKPVSQTISMVVAADSASINGSGPSA